MPRKPRRERRLKFPGLGASFEKKLKFFSQENERLKRENSVWRYGLSSADKRCFCLLAAESYDQDFEKAMGKKRGRTSKKAVEMDENGLETAKIELETKNKDNE
jgi:hypothetical protein